MAPRSSLPRPLLLVGLAGLLTACAPVPAPGGKGLQVVTTILPITLFTRAVAGSCAEVTALVPPGSTAHDVQASPASLLSLRQARVLVKNGLGMETFLEPLVRSAQNPELRVIDSSRGVATLTGDEHTDAPNDGHGHGSVNPHIWLDPLRAEQQVNTIRDGLVQADPGCAATYRRNAAATTASLRALHAEIAGQLRPYRGRSFVAFHDVAPYFAQRYGLRATFLVDVPEQNPSPQDLQRVAQEVQRSQLRALLSEPQEGRRSFNALAEDLGVRISVFDPLERGDARAAADFGTYLSVMRRNTANLLEAIRQ
jgi:zinc/manganese transport system substrate-binding protein